MGFKWETNRGVWCETPVACGSVQVSFDHDFDILLKNIPSLQMIGILWRVLVLLRLYFENHLHRQQLSVVDRNQPVESSRSRLAVLSKAQAGWPAVTLGKRFPPDHLEVISPAEPVKSTEQELRSQPALPGRLECFCLGFASCSRTDSGIDTVAGSFISRELGRCTSMIRPGCFSSHADGELRRMCERIIPYPLSDEMKGVCGECVSEKSAAFQGVKGSRGGAEVTCPLNQTVRGTSRARVDAVTPRLFASSGFVPGELVLS
ncbi:unnamed protein product [Pleuronectes platessa]|uniref:Uncharacterized protein n=1 Tax=Pleuronectes platessa TaxID=8262 RepID=A0A9N7UEY8_PLEPL|nr:unnamed protein product [Pleuronectes platessa]